jgi:hypothetical protein
MPQSKSPMAQETAPPSDPHDAVPPGESSGTGPIVSIAHELVEASYTWCLTRYEAVDNRLGALVTLASTVTLGIPILGRGVLGEKAELRGQIFWAAITAGGLAMLIAVIGRACGSVRLPNPGRFLTKAWLTLDANEAERWLVYRAGHAFTVNAKRIGWKGRASDAATLLIILEVLSFLARYFFVGPAGFVEPGRVSRTSRFGSGGGGGGFAGVDVPFAIF